MGIARWLAGDTRECVAGRYLGERIPPGARGMHLDPAQIPTTLMEPSMEAAQPPDAPLTGWECPRCRRVWSPRVRQCLECRPEGDEMGREIREG